MYYDIKSDRLYNNEYAMEGIFGKLKDKIGESKIFAMQKILDKYNCKSPNDVVKLMYNTMREEVNEIKNDKKLMKEIREFCKENMIITPVIIKFEIDYRGYIQIITADSDVEEEFAEKINQRVIDAVNDKYADFIKVAKITMVNREFGLTSFAFYRGRR